jgi:hypothetical protein
MIVARAMDTVSKVQLYQHTTALVPAHLAAKLDAEAASYWDRFYKRNKDRFFKDRHYLHREFPLLMTPGVSVLEVCDSIGDTTALTDQMP